MNKQTKWLVGLVSALIVINIALVAMLWLKKDNSTQLPRGDAKNFLVEKLSLTKAQQNSFDSLRKGHFEKMRGYQDRMRQLKDDFFNQLSHPEIIPDSLAQKISSLQSTIDLETFDHFSKLRSILNEEQKKKFDNVIQDVLHTMAPRGGPPPIGHDREDPPPPDGPPQ